MPLVPRFTPEVATQAAPNVRQDPHQPIEAFGGGAAAGGLINAGQALGAIAAEHKQRADATALMEADNAAWNAEKTYFHAPETGLFAKTGKDAVAYRPKALEGYEAEITRIESTLSTREQRERFRGIAQQRRQSLDLQSLRFEAQEADRHNGEVLELKFATAIDEAVANRTDPNRLDDVIGGLAGAIEASMPRASTEARALKLREARSAVLTAVIAGRMGDDFASAESFFHDHAELLTGEDRLRVEAQLRPVADMIELEAGLDQIEQGLPPASAGVSDDYSAKRRQLESGGDPNAVNAASGAAGPDQFLASTWAGLVDRYKPKWARGMTPAEVLHARFDPEKSAEMVGHFDRENAGVLRRGGAPVNDHTMYLAHHFGAEGALKILRAPDGTPMRSLVSKAAYEANPHLHNKTKAQVIESFARRGMGSAPTTAATPAPARTLGERLALVDATVSDPRDRARYKAGLRARDQERRAAEADADRALQDGLFTKLETADPSIPLQRLLTPTELAWAQREGRVSSLEARRHQRIEGQFVQDNPKLAEELMRERALDPERFAKRVLPSYADQLSTATLTELVSSQKAMRGKAADVDDYATEEQQLAIAFEDAGIPSGEKGTERRAALRRAFLEEQRAVVQNTGKKPNAEQRRSILKALTLQTVRDGWFGDTESNVFEADPTKDKVVVPANAASIIAARFKERTGRAPSDAQLRQLYLESVRYGAEY